MEGLRTAKFLKMFISGAVIGTGAIIPGVSGGVIAVAMGLYEKILDAVSNFFKSPKKNLIFLFPIGLGAVSCIYLLSGIVAWFMKNYSNQVIFLFFGLVVGSIPSLIKKANKNGFKVKYLIIAMLGIFLILSLEYLEFTVSSKNMSQSLDFVTAFICGAVLSVGTIVPGISTSFILIYLGTYENVMQAIHTLDLLVLIPMGIGFIATSLAIIKLVNYLFKNYTSYAYYAVLGLLIGSMVLIIPSDISSMLLLNTLLFAAGFAIQIFLSKI
ncbi:MAG: DUF368 domain-containing protein [Tissierellia bacterium]|nr:DUF368 domain-containing protein [Tissierellia bacterium]